jgi:voltage-gated potassium channel
VDLRATSRPSADPGRPLRRRLHLLALAPVALVLVGAAGYRVIEGWPAFDALYMSVTTLTTIGYAEVHPLGTGGRAFTMILALGGIFTIFFTTAEFLRAVISGELSSHLGRHRMEKKIAGLNGHVIVCGYGRVGQQVCSEFAAASVPFVIIDKAADRLADFALPAGHPVVGDATDDAVLHGAGIDRARAVVVVVASDADNVFITMSARLLADRVPIVARAEDAASIPKLMRAGANRVISPHVIGGGRVAQAVLRPAVLDFIEVATRSEHLDLQIEEVPVSAGSGLDGRTIESTGVRGDIGLILVAVKQRSGHMLFNPPDSAALVAGDTLIVLGKRQQLDRADRLARASN